MNGLKFRSLLTNINYKINIMRSDKIEQDRIFDIDTSEEDKFDRSNSKRLDKLISRQL